MEKMRGWRKRKKGKPKKTWGEETITRKKREGGHGEGKKRERIKTTD